MSAEVVRRQVVVQCKEGLHLRAVSVLVQSAKRYQSTIRVQKDNQAVDGKSVMELLTLGAEAGHRLTLEAEGTDAAEAVQALSALFESGFQSSATTPPT